MDPGSGDDPRNPVKTRILLVDDHQIVRDGLRTVIEAHDDLEVVAEAATVAEAISRAVTFEPDVVVLDVSLPDGRGPEACREIRRRVPDAQVLMLTSFEDDAALFESIMAGASGFLLKQVRSAELLDAIRRIGAGESILDPAVTERVLDRVRNPRSQDDPRLAKLTPTEVRIVDHIARGRTNREIGDEVGLAEKTVKNYVSSILSKLQVARRAEAAAYFVEHRRDS